MTQQTEATSSVKPHIVELSDKLVKEITIDKTTGIGTPSGDDLFLKTLTHGVTADEVTRVEGAKTDFVHASVRALGQLTVQALSENPELNRTTTKLAVGRDNVTVSIDRTASYPNPRDPESRIVKHGAVSLGYETRSASNSGQLKHVKNELGLAAAAAQAAQDAAASKKKK